ncbi:dehydratase (plasmid) [Pacificitalea manganoxidans]|uniref:Dehydratase n=1 Tax=Pacificitalea manganoxidans TaxID=1411902 RepID=A0A291M447_9RHOB|nr:MaoC/PaaZ C-terminal domain-containing protein [Pacificitalea manganoxidans]ATI43689.1 dehydratase [Pacificitalea manganoxidans]MDR6310083.1 acyl dehydratase [Pacificitalea manganoxidans]
MPKFYEDLKVGDKFVTPRRTITEADIVAFSGLSGDYNALHTDEIFAAETQFGGRIAHGPLGFVIATGLSNRTGLFDGSTIAFLGMQWKFTAPIYPGDTVHLEMTVDELRRTSKPDRGILVREMNLINQKGQLVQTGMFTTMIKVRDPAAE